MRASTTGSLGHREWQLVDDDATQLLALHVHSLPERRRREQHAVRRGAELFEQRASRRRALHQRRVLDLQRHAIVHQPHLLIAGEQHERAAAAQFAGARRISSAACAVKAGCADRADAAARTAAPASGNRTGSSTISVRAFSSPRRFLRELEPAGHGERRRGQHDSVDACRTASVRGSARRRSASPADSTPRPRRLDPVDELAAWTLPSRTAAAAGIQLRGAGQRDDLFGCVLDAASSCTPISSMRRAASRRSDRHAVSRNDVVLA